MSPKSAVTTLKIILAIDLLIVALAVPSFLYVDSLVPKSASFEVSDLIIYPNWLQIGEPVQASVKITNVGEKSGDYMVTMTIDDEPIATETVRLSGQDSKTLVFTVTEVALGEHTVKVEDLTGTLKVTVEAPTGPAQLKITDLGVSRIEAGVGDVITVSATATNIGDEDGEFTVVLLVNNNERETRNIQLEAKDSEFLAFEVAENTEGIYEIKLGDSTTSFKITSEAQPAKPAEFHVTELTVDPNSVVGGESVDVSVKVTNVGEETGSYSVELNVDGTKLETTEVTLSGGATQVVTFEVTETGSGTHTVEIGDLSGSFTVENLSPPSENIEITNVKVKPYEVWAGDAVAVIIKATNLVNEPGTLQVRILIKDEVKATKGFDLEAGATDVELEVALTAGAVGNYPVTVVNLGNEKNTKSGYFKVVENGLHTLSVGSYPVVGIPFKLDGVEYTTPYTQLLPEGDYGFEVEPTYDSGKYIFIGWEDNSTSLKRTVTLNERKSITTDFSGGICCPSVYSWNGTDYYYNAELSNPGWLGYIGYITDDGTIIFVGGNPWDGVKLDSNQLAIKEIGNRSYYDVTLTQKWDEIFYLDAAYLMVVDHPADVDVYSTIVRYINPSFIDTIYTVSQTPMTPLSAVNEKGEDVLSLITEMDGVFTPGINGLASELWDNGTWNQLTVNLGDLSDAKQIKLLLKGMVDWGPADVYYDWIDQFKAAAAEGLMQNGTQITPPPFIEVLDENGDWVRVPEDRQIPIPADYVARPFIVDLTGIFLSNNYSIRLNNFWNVTFDYIGVDTTPQESLTIQRIDATAELRQIFETPSEASGDFTRYGDVTELVHECDDIFVIGMQGDEVALLFPVDDIAPAEEGTERTAFLFGACWFKDTPTNWGFGFDFTVEPIPFRNMTGFPYTDVESYPYDAEHTAYISEYNTRTIIDPRTLEPQPASLSTWASAVLLVMVVVDLGIIVYYRKQRQ